MRLSNLYKISLFLICSISLLLIADKYPAGAHVLETHGSIGVVIHIDPDDDPVAGEPSVFHFEFKDKEDRLRLPECDCTMKIYKDNQELFYTELTSENGSSHNHDSAGTDNTAAVSYTFTEKGVYTINLNGKPRNQNTFPEFLITDTIRVERESVSARPLTDQGTDKITTQHSSTYHDNLLHIFIFLLTLVSFSVRILTNIKPVQKNVTVPESSNRD